MERGWRLRLRKRDPWQRAQKLRQERGPDISLGQEGEVGEVGLVRQMEKAQKELLSLCLLKQRKGARLRMLVE